jgi:hypothetical protein
MAAASLRHAAFKGRHGTKSSSSSSSSSSSTEQQQQQQASPLTSTCVH